MSEHRADFEHIGQLMHLMQFCMILVSDGSCYLTSRASSSVSLLKIVSLCCCQCIRLYFRSFQMCFSLTLSLGCTTLPHPMCTAGKLKSFQQFMAVCFSKCDFITLRNRCSVSESVTGQKHIYQKNKKKRRFPSEA